MNIKKRLISIILAATALLWHPISTAAQQAFVHPGMAQNAHDLELMRQQALNGKEPYKSAFDRLRQEVGSDHTPIGAVTHLSQGPYGTDDIGGKQLDHDSKSAYNNALMWYITRDQIYADKAIQIINTWSGKLWDLDDNNAKLLAGLSGHFFLNAAELLRYSGAGWRPADITQFKQFMLTVYYPLIYDFFPQANGNWDASMINTMLCIGVFCDNRQIFDRAINRYHWGIGNGGITKYIYPGGQIQETSRDWGHVQLGIGEFAKAAAVAWTQGVDLYSSADNRLAQGFEYAAKYMLGGQVPVYGNISVRERQKFRDIYESVYAHYHNYAGIEMPFTQEVIAKTRPQSAAGYLSSVRSLPNRINRQAAARKAVKVLYHAGALADPSAPAPAGAILVKVGQSVQQAIDAGAGKPCWIVLEKGIHHISDPLRLPDFLTLSGQGRESVLMLESKAIGKTILNANKELHEVTLRDFLIEGSTSDNEGEDPNNNRRTRANQNAQSREGIAFSCEKMGEISHIKLIHLTVQNFTKNGVAFRGAAQVLIDSCNFSGNGSSLVPGPGIQHNLLITHGADCKIAHSRFDDSPWGSGMMILLTNQISVNACELARNKQSGLLCAYSKGMVIESNLAEGNDGDGITITSPADLKVNASQNWCWYNGGHGLQAEQINLVRANNKIIANRLK